MKLRIAVFGLLLVTLSCSREKLEKYEQLGGLRVLALVADTPEVDAGATVNITPYVSDFGEASSLSFTAVACLDKGVSFGAEPSCDSNPSATTVASGTISTLSAARSFTGAADPFAVTVPTGVIVYANRSSQQQHNGLAYLVDYRLSNTRGETVKSLKRILVSTRSIKNQNPGVTDINANGSSLGTLPLGGAVDLSPVLSGVGLESYDVILDDGSSRSDTEELMTTWFISDGELKSSRTLGQNTVKYQGPGAAPSGRDAFIVAVSRDGRGGTSVVKKCFGACP